MPADDQSDQNDDLKRALTALEHERAERNRIAREAADTRDLLDTDRATLDRLRAEHADTTGLRDAYGYHLHQLVDAVEAYLQTGQRRTVAEVAERERDVDHALRAAQGLLRAEEAGSL